MKLMDGPGQDVECWLALLAMRMKLSVHVTIILKDKKGEILKRHLVCVVTFLIKDYGVIVYAFYFLQEGKSNIRT